MGQAASAIQASTAKRPLTIPEGFGDGDPFKSHSPTGNILSKNKNIKQAISQTNLTKLEPGHKYYDPSEWDIYDPPYPGNVANPKIGTCLIHGVKIFRDRFGNEMPYHLISVVRPLQDPPVSTEHLIAPQFIVIPGTGEKYYFLQFVPCIIFKLVYNPSDPLNSIVTIRTLNHISESTLGEVNRLIYPTDKGVVPNADLRRARDLFVISNFEFKLSNDIFVKYTSFNELTGAKELSTESSNDPPPPSPPSTPMPIEGEMTCKKVIEISPEKLYKKNQKLLQLIESELTK